MSKVSSASGSQVSVTVAGVGSYLPDQRVSNQQMLERVDPRHPDGTPFAPDWIERHIGINERRLDFDFAAGRKRERSKGGLFTSAASTLILLDEDRRANRVREGDFVVFLWIGAGNGAMNGYAALIL